MRWMEHKTGGNEASASGEAAARFMPSTTR
jgi:hypothetical protein